MLKFYGAAVEDIREYLSDALTADRRLFEVAVEEDLNIYF